MERAANVFTRFRDEIGASLYPFGSSARMWTTAKRDQFWARLMQRFGASREGEVEIARTWKRTQVEAVLEAVLEACLEEL